MRRSGWRQVLAAVAAAHRSGTKSTLVGTRRSHFGQVQIGAGGVPRLYYRPARPSNTAAAGAPRADGVSRRTRAGSGDTRARVAAAPTSRTPAKMRDLDRGREEDTSAARANGGAEVDVFQIHEVSLVEQADRFGVGAPHQQARAADPVGILLAAASTLDVAPAMQLLPELVERPDHLAERQLGACRRRRRAADRRPRRPDDASSAASSASIAPAARSCRC